MRENASTVIIGRRVCLLPYLPAHIERYHAWMQDEELLRLTGREPLTLEEETQNQQSWREDPNKVTFIVCATAAMPSGDASAPSLSQDVTTGMCGDVNAFLWEEDVEDEDASNEDSGAVRRRLCAELEVMIADPRWRRHGLAREALLLLIHWLCAHVPAIGVLVVKITDDNVPSRQLFEALGFVTHKHMAVFEQTELRMELDAARTASALHWDQVGARVLHLAEEAEAGSEQAVVQPEPPPSTASAST